MEVGNVFVQRLLLVYSSLKRRIASLTFNPQLLLTFRSSNIEWEL